MVAFSWLISSTSEGEKEKGEKSILAYQENRKIISLHCALLKGLLLILRVVNDLHLFLKVACINVEELQMEVLRD